MADIVFVSSGCPPCRPTNAGPSPLTRGNDPKVIDEAAPNLTDFPSSLLLAWPRLTLDGRRERAASSTPGVFRSLTNCSASKGSRSIGGAASLRSRCVPSVDQSLLLQLCHERCRNTQFIGQTFQVECPFVGGQHDLLEHLPNFTQCRRLQMKDRGE